MVNYVAHVVVFIALFGILALSLNLVLGYAGVFSAMHAVFFGVGAYLTAFVAIQLGVPFPLDLLTGLVAGGVIAALVGAPLMRLTQDYVVIGTLALQLVFFSVFLNWTQGTGGSYGVYGIPRPVLGGVPVLSPAHYALLSAAVAALCFFLLWRLAHAPFGLALKALREDEPLAQSFGKDVPRQRMLAFAIGGGVAAVAGGLYARYVGYINPSSFDVLQSLNLLIFVVVGGLGNLWGTLAATSVLVTVPQVLRFIPATSTAVPHIQLTLFGLLLLLLVRLRPEGLISEKPLVRAGPAAPRREPGEARADPPLKDLFAGVAAPPTGTRLLEFRNVTRSFGGIRAVNALSFEVLSGRVTAIIGPNGAGKTTVFNLTTGHLRPDRGEILYRGRPLTRLPPFEIARLGVARSFQGVRIFSRMSVIENVVLALQRDETRRIWAAFVPSERARGERRELLARAGRLLHAFGLGGAGDQRGATLAYAEQKVLMIANLIGCGAPFVMLDEPASGLDPESTARLARLVRHLAEEGYTICVIEHNLDFVWRIADTVIVLDQGALVAQGTPEEIRRDRRVAEIYFGSYAAADA